MLISSTGTSLIFGLWKADRRTWQQADTGGGTGTDGGEGGEGSTPPAGGGEGGEGGQAGAGGDGNENPYSWMGDDVHLSDQDKHYLESKRFTKPMDLFKSLRHAETALRGEKIAAPPENPERRAEWYKDSGVAQALGIPEKPDDYEVAQPKFSEEIAPMVQYDDARHGRFLEAAHANNLTPQQAQGLLEFYSQEIGNDVQAYEAARQADETEMQATLTKEWGNDYERRKTAAVEMAVEMGLSTEQAEALRQGNVAGSTTMYKILDELAQVRGSDTLKGGQRGQGGMTKESAQAELTEFEQKNRDALINEKHSDHIWAKAQRDKLRKAAGRGSAGVSS